MLTLNKEFYPASIRQRIEWNLYIDSGKTLSCNIPYITHLKKPDIEILKKTFYQLADRHESFRTTFSIVKGELKQIVKDVEDYTLDFEVHEFRNKIRWLRSGQSFISTLIETPIDLENGPLTRVILIQLGKGTYKLLFLIHHIIADAVSLQVLEKEFTEIYQSLLAGKVPSLKPFKYQLKDYAKWEQDFLQSTHGKDNQAYWEKELKGFSTPFTVQHTLLKKKRFNFPKKEKGASEYLVVFRPELNTGIHQLTKELRLTKFCFLLTGLFLFLHHISKQKDLIVAAQISLRDRRELLHLIGYLTSGIYIRIQIDEQLSAKDFMMKVRDKYLDALDHKLFSMDKLEIPVDNYCGAILNEHSPSPKFMGTLKNFRSRFTGGNYNPFYPFDIGVTQYQNGIKIKFSHKNTFLSGIDIPHLFERFHLINKALVEDPHKSIKSILKLIE